MDTHLQSLALLLGITETVNGTWIEAIARHQITITEIPLANAGLLFDAVLADPFVVADWKSSYISTMSGLTLEFKGIAESNGDFSTEDSYNVMNGVSDSAFGFGKETIVMSYHYVATGGTLLGSLQQSYNIALGNIDNVNMSYKYEEDSAATGANPKYVHDFRITIDSTQVLGYVIINADDSEFHNFIIDSAA
jgi:hypothetical protein